VEILSTGGTARLLREAGVEVVEVSDYTGFPEMMDGRVKTLHPKVHGGLLARRDNPADLEQAAAHGISLIDLVAINLYPFEQTVARPDVSLAEAIENIDIGGPAMLRAASKNHESVAVICNPHRYEEVLAELRDTHGGLSLATRRSLALDAFRHTAHYDAAIARYLAQQYEPQEQPFPRVVNLPLEKVCNLTSSEAPNRKAAFYREVGPARNGLVGATQLHGPELTFEPLRDAAAAWEKCLESGEPTVVGGVLAVPRPVDEAAAVELGGRALEVLVALSFEEKALEILQRQENLILLSLEHATALQDPGWDFVRVGNGFLVRERQLTGNTP
jgi:phosphoribosylaminoimidazolecarboxamide formyltransferase/IMP cyclohydrolase